MPIDGIPGVTTGKLAKMTVEAHDNPERNRAIKKYEFMYNPNTYSERFEMQVCERQGPGMAGTELVFQRVPPNNYTFDLLFDGTGASKPSFGIGVGVGLPGINLLKKGPTVREQIQEFLSVAYEYDSKLHRPKFLTICWGEAIQNNVINCVLTSADVNYTLFRPDGTPLRAKMKAVFRESRSIDQVISKMNSQSPDLSHVRGVSEADNLPLLSNEVYESPDHYIEVAKSNRLKNFRRLKIGKELRFPPLRPAGSS